MFAGLEKRGPRGPVWPPPEQEAGRLGEGRHEPRVEERRKRDGSEREAKRRDRETAQQARAWARRKQRENEGRDPPRVKSLTDPTPTSRRLAQVRQVLFERETASLQVSSLFDERVSLQESG